MGAANYTQDNQAGRLTTALGKDALLLLELKATERLSTSYTVTIRALSAAPQPIHTLLGTPVGVAFRSDANAHLTRDFGGMLWEYTELGHDERGWHYELVVRPELHFLTLNKRNRIFQNTSAIDIVTSLVVGDYRAALGGAYDALDYCVQYQESDFAFLSRLLEYEGVYYYYAHDGDAAQLVLIDDANAHPDLAPASVRVLPRADRRPDAPIWSVTERRGVGPAKVTVADYDFEAPSTQLLKVRSAAKVLGTPTARGAQGAEGTPGGWSEGAELYEFPGKYTSKQAARGEGFGAAWLASHRRRMARSFAEGQLFAAAVGRRLTLAFDDGTSADYLIVGTVHDYAAPDYASGEGEEHFLCSLELMPAAEQYRPALATPRPRILGPQTAIVVGPAGEEIHTDRHGRIKVQFFWDREGARDENAGCFIRVVQSGAGQGWGSFALPRIGQEVVVEFLDGDPDRPLVTGAVYNADNTVPAALPDNKTQFGFKSRITKGGGGFNHHWFDDKKGAEVVWFRAERDYKAHIVNADEVRQYDKGHRTTTFDTGNDTLTVSKGTRTATIHGDDTATIRSGDVVHTVQAGKRTTSVFGDDALTVKTGDIAVKAALGKITIEAMQSIELKVGGSSITIDPVGIKVKGAVSVDIKGVMVQSSADAVHVVKGGLVTIN